MRMNFFLICFAAIVSGFSVSATAWMTSTFGSWNNGATWNGGIAPLYSISDTFYIMHPITIDQQLTLQPGAFLYIHNGAGICGHEFMLMENNSEVHNFGIIEIDSMYIIGGSLINTNPGYVYFSHILHITSGGYLNNNGGGMHGGPWFECHQPEYSYLTGIEEAVTETDLLIYPNPATDELHFNKPSFAEYLLISDMSGRYITTYKLNNDSESVPLNSYSNGLYLLTFYDADNRNFVKQKLIIQR